VNGFTIDHVPVSLPEPMSYTQEEKKQKVSSQKTVKKVEIKKPVVPVIIEEKKTIKS
jgi:hypothetical protein